MTMHNICLMEKYGKLSLNYHQISTLSVLYTPGIYAKGYIVFAFPFILSSVRMFVRSFVTPSRT